MDLDALLARSKQPGQFVERQSFTLSRSKALAKMRDFTLRTPDQFGLEIVQAGVFAGARWIFVDADAHACTIGWVGGRSLKRAQLQQLLDYLFVAEGASDDRHLRQLAVAVNVLVRKKPIVLRVESGDGETAVRLDLDKDGNGTVGTPAESLHGTYVHVRFSEPWFWDTQSRSPAAELIETECIFSPTPIFVNGDGPYGSERHVPLTNPMVHEQVLIRRHGRDGWLSLPHMIDPNPRVQVVVGGVIVSRRTIPELHEGLVGVVRDDQLAKTADMSDVVADENWLRFLHAVQSDVVGYLEPLLPEYVPKELDPIEAVVDEDDDVPRSVPLDDGIRLVGLAERMPVDRLEAFADEPLYAVHPADAEDVQASLGPWTFPGRVGILDDDQIRTLSAQLGRPVHRVAPEDARTLTDHLRRHHTVQEVTVDTPNGLLHLRLHQSGPLPGWRLHPHGLPVLVERGDGSHAPHTLVLHLPRVSAVLDLDADVDDEDLLLADLTHLIERHVWELAVATADPQLTRALLEQALFLQADPANAWQARFPTPWPTQAEALLDIPLTPDGPTARAFLETLGTPDVLEVTPAQHAELTALEARFGPGHLASSPARSLVLLAHGPTGWNHLPSLPSDADAFVWVADRFGARAPQGWVDVPSPHPLVVCAQRPGVAVSFDYPLQRLANLLRDVPDRRLADREARVLRLARLALDPAGAPLPMGEDTWAAATAVKDGRTKVALQGGTVHDSTDTAIVSVDEAVVLGDGLRWRFDDPPALWAPEPRPEDWLVTAAIVDDGLEGWLGLRFPYDPTGGVLLQQGLETRVVDERPHGIRFHGWIRQVRGRDPLPALRQHTLDVLEALLALEDLPAERMEAVHRYAADFATIARVHPASGIPEELGNRLASAVPVAAWGDLASWMGAPSAHRPDLPFVVRGLTGDVLDPQAVLTTEEGSSRVLDAFRLTLSRAGVRSRTSLFVNPDGWFTDVWESGAINVSFGGRSSVVRRAEEGHRKSMGLVQLEAVRRYYLFEVGRGTSEVDLLTLQASALESVQEVLS